MIQTKRFVVLDSFRGVCALSVVIFHLHVSGTITEFNFFRNAHLFVEFFFVLSGFVLFHTYKDAFNNYRDFSPFIIKRIFRLYPLHFFMLALFILFECGKWYAETKGFNFNGHAFSGRNSLKEVLPNLLLLQSWLNQAEPLSFNGPSWSISAELYVYMLFAVILISSRKFSVSLFALISGFSFFALAMNLDILNNNILRVCSCFFAGILAYYVYQQILSYSLSKQTLTLLEGLGLVMIFVILNWNIKHQGIIASIWFCMVIIVYSLEGGFFSSLLKHSFFRRLGTLSYSIYMIHFAVIFLLISASIVASALSHHNFAPMLKEPQTGELIRYITTDSWLGNNLLVLAVLTVIVGLAHLSWKFIEKPGIAWGERFLFRYKKDALHLRASATDPAS
ncbi:acyltransferase family protein [Legionella longbeachae]|uniref:acyltransferase family protein n=1 Tax=Legionella longbeachae TaxID=450 RepID=UPI00124550ED|nr:acyltransferase [Legionella longbeachae]QEY50103.1 acyltransferase [Legionella longbeachae]QEY50233.1 acyltransferase [Legionella longbeachae]